ncbi:MAG: hypothetical protein K1X53_07255 [Candidatus Sumerlaeaceae bacterium]|nr:hypothetical protein [Candidatus Sumerlaeaceae bacterium]
MSAVTISLITFGCVFGSALAGLFLDMMLPQSHLQGDSKDTVKVGTGIIATLAALVLGLLVSSSKASFDKTSDALANLSTKMILTDRLLARYGPETMPIRLQLKSAMTTGSQLLMSGDEAKIGQLDTPESAQRSEKLLEAVKLLAPKTDLQKDMQSQAVSAMQDFMATRWQIVVQRKASVSLPLLMVMVFWLSLNFLSIGLFAPRNVTVFAILLLCAVSLAGAIFIIVEMNNPLTGVIKVSDTPIKTALDHLGT